MTEPIDWKARCERVEAVARESVAYGGRLEQRVRSLTAELAELRTSPTKGERDLEMRVCEMEAELAKALGLDDDPEVSPWDGMISYVKRLREDWSHR